MTTSRQERLSHKDTIESQEKLREFLDFKIRYPFVSQREKDAIPQILADALWSQGVMSLIKPVLKIDKKIYLLGNDVHHLGLRLIDMKVIERDKHYYTKVDGKEIEAKILWQTLKEYCLILFPKALAESLARSKEKEKRQYTPTVHDFSSRSEDPDSDL
jgi:hypothetical protein